MVHAFSTYQVKRLLKISNYALILSVFYLIIRLRNFQCDWLEGFWNYSSKKKFLKFCIDCLPTVKNMIRVVRCAIWFYLFNLRNVTGVFHFSKLYKWYQIAQRTTRVISRNVEFVNAPNNSFQKRENYWKCKGLKMSVAF